MLFLFRKMTQFRAHGRLISTAVSYEDAIQTLNTLQTNAAYLQTNNHTSGSESLHTMKKYLLRSGVTLEDLDKLSIIHVAGTKGKGSTCAFVESILRNYGFRTGFYSSPHLIHVTERIRINGRPVEEDIFTKYFWHVYNELNTLKENDLDMPTYFKFMTVLMFHIFLQTNIDVVILEVGIGGEYDCTNLVRRPVCVGITSLGLEHTSLLGNTLEEIAHQKSGIFKEQTIAFTVPQPDNAMNIIKQRAIERNCQLYMIPDFKSYNWEKGPPVLGIAGDIQRINASLAIQLAHTWIFEKTNKNVCLPNCGDLNDSRINITETNHAISDSLCMNYIKTDHVIGSGVSGLNLFGKSGNNNFLENQHDDNAICVESQVRASSTTSNKSQAVNKPARYNKEHSVTDQMPITVSLPKTALALSSCTWPGRTQILRGHSMDFYLDGAHTYESMEICVSWYLSQIKNKVGNRYLIFNTTGNRDVTKLLLPLQYLPFDMVYFVPNVSGIMSKVDQFELNTTSDQQQDRCRKNLDIWVNGNAVALNSVSEALTHISVKNNSNANIESDKNRPQVLITGSLHLVGAALLFLDPKLTMKTDY